MNTEGGSIGVRPTIRSFPASNGPEGSDFPTLLRYVYPSIEILTNKTDFAGFRVHLKRPFGCAPLLATQQYTH